MVDFTDPPPRPTGFGAAWSAMASTFFFDWLRDQFYDQLVAFAAQVDQIAPSVDVAAIASGYMGDYNPDTYYQPGGPGVAAQSVSYLGSVFLKKTAAPAGTVPVDGPNWLELKPFPNPEGQEGKLLMSEAGFAAWKSIGWTQIASAAATGLTLDFTSIPQTYEDLLIAYSGVTCTSGGSNHYLKVTTGTGLAGNIGATSTSAQSGGVLIPRYRGDSGVMIAGIGETSGNDAFGSGISPLGWRRSGGISALRLGPQGGGTMNGGTITLFGRR